MRDKKNTPIEISLFFSAALTLSQLLVSENLLDCSSLNDMVLATDCHMTILVTDEMYM